MANRKRRRKLKKGPVIGLLLILLLLILLLIFLIYTNTNKYLFFKGISKTSENIIDSYNTFIDSYIPYINEDYYNNTDTSMRIDTEDLNKDINLKGDIYLTDKSNYFNLDVDVNKSKYELELLTKDNKLYYTIDNSRYYYMDYESNSFANNYSNLFEILIKAIKDNVSNSDFDKTKEDIIVNSKNYNTKKITLVLANEKYHEVMKAFYEKVKGSDDLLNTLFSISSYETKEELINYIDTYIKSDKKTESNSLEYSIYLYKSNPIMNQINFSDYEVSYITSDDYLEFNYYEEDSASYIKVFDNKIDLFINGIGYGNGKYDDNSFDVDFVDYDKKSLGSISYSIDKKSKNYSTKLDLLLELELIKLDIDSSNKINVNKAIPDIDISNSVISDNMTENDKKTLEELLSHINDIIAF